MGENEKAAETIRLSAANILIIRTNDLNDSITIGSAQEISIWGLDFSGQSIWKNLPRGLSVRS